MAYLIYRDYQTTIQDRQYIQLVQNSDAKRLAAEQWAISIVRGKLTQKYDVTREFTDTLPFSPAKQYNVRDRVVIDYPLWSVNATYNINDCVVYSGTGYVCTEAGSSATFNPAHWSPLGAQYAIYYVSYPSVCAYQGQPNPATLADPYAPEFSLIDIAKAGEQKLYWTGDIVFWKGYLYTCIYATQQVTDAQVIQYTYYKDVPYINVFPDDAVNNNANQFWGNKTAYTIPAGTLPTDTAYWTPGDNRTPEIVECVKDITVWKLSGLLNFRREEWEARYSASLDQLSCYANGYATLLMPRIAVPRGMRSRYGSHPKNINTY